MAIKQQTKLGRAKYDRFATSTPYLVRNELIRSPAIGFRLQEARPSSLPFNAIRSNLFASAVARFSASKDGRATAL
jgi:hypothetical protein